MAVGMHALAQDYGDIAPQDKNDVNILGEEAEQVKGSIEINILPDSSNQEALQILKARQMQSNPIAAVAGRTCHSGEPGSESIRRKEEDTNPLLQIIYSFMPCLEWMPTLNRSIVKADLIAGLTVGVMVIPQSMSYASIAGLPYIYGMYSACIPTIVYGLFGQSRQLAVGPVAMVSLLVEAGLRGKLTKEECPEWTTDSEDSQAELCPEAYVNLAILTAAVVGIMMVVGTFMKMGFLVSFLGHPVTSGFTSGAAIIIGLSQVKYMFGFTIPKSQYVHETVGHIIAGLGETKPMTLVLGLVWLGYLRGNKMFAAKHKKYSLLGALGPLISCVAGILLLFLCTPLRDKFHVKIVGTIPDGLMPMSMGAWQLGRIPDVISTALPACLIGYMESIAIGKSLAAKNGYEIEAGQEMFAIGMSNLIGAMFSCYPVTGSFSRSAVAASTGAMSQLQGLITAAVMFCTLMFLTPLFRYLPQFALAAIVINSVIPLVAYQEALHLWHVKKQDCLLWVVAFLGTLFLGVLMGICVAVGLSLVIVIYESVRPQITILWRIPGTDFYRNYKQESCGTFVPNVFICRVGSSMYFANASYVKDMLLAYTRDLEDVNKTEYIVIEMTAVTSVDSTAVLVLKDIVNDFRSKDPRIEVAFAMVGNRVQATFERAGLLKSIGKDWFFPSVEQAVQHCLRHQHIKKVKSAHRRSREMTQGTEPGEPVREESLQVDPAGIRIDLGNEVGITNDRNPDCTTVFITLADDLPMLMSDIAAVFKKFHISVVQASIEEDGKKHIYQVKDESSGLQLNAYQRQRLNDEITSAMNSAARRSGPMSPLSREGSSKLKALEEQIQSLNKKTEELTQTMLATNAANAAAAAQQHNFVTASPATRASCLPSCMV
jgi:sulfate transporter 4